MTGSMVMIHVDGITYRIGCLDRNACDIVRVLDDVSLGACYRQGTAFSSTFIAGGNSLGQIARIAVRQGKIIHSRLAKKPRSDRPAALRLKERSLRVVGTTDRGTCHPARVLDRCLASCSE